MCLDFVRQGVEKSVLFQLAFPYYYKIPAEVAQSVFRYCVPFDVPLELFPPEFNVRGGRRCPSAPSMPMPITTTHFDCSLELRQNNVRSAGKSFYMEPEPESVAMQERTHDKLRGRTF